jgi:AcrR family transcriptional regulator
MVRDWEVIVGVAERRARERQQRVDTIIAAAEKVIFASGVEHVTMQQIADEVELNKATIYLYFANKDDLLHAIIARGLDILIGMFEAVLGRDENGLATAEALARAYFDFYRTYPDYHRVLYHRERPAGSESEPGEPTPYDLVTDDQARKLFQLIARAVDRGAQDGSIRKDIDASCAAALLLTQLSGVVQTVDAKGEVLALTGVSTDEIFAGSVDMIRSYFIARS